MEQIKLSCTAKDKISGYTGIVEAITYWLNGCTRITIKSRELKDGKPIENQTFDLEQLEYVDIGLNFVQKPTGGDRTTPIRAADPTR